MSYNSEMQLVCSALHATSGNLSLGRAFQVLGCAFRARAMWTGLARLRGPLLRCILICTGGLFGARATGQEQNTMTAVCVTFQCFCSPRLVSSATSTLAATLPLTLVLAAHGSQGLPSAGPHPAT